GHQRAACHFARLCRLHAVRRRRRHHDRAAVQRAFGHGHGVRPESLRGRDPRRHYQRLGRDARRADVRPDRSADHRPARLVLHADPQLRAGHRRARADAQRALRARRGGESVRLAAYIVVFAAALAFTWGANQYYVFIMAMLGITAIVGIGLNVLLGLTGQVSFGHVGFYALGAYTVAILAVSAKWSFWAALPVAALVATLTGAL